MPVSTLGCAKLGERQRPFMQTLAMNDPAILGVMMTVRTIA